MRAAAPQPWKWGVRWPPGLRFGCWKKVIFTFIKVAFFYLANSIMLRKELRGWKGMGTITSFQPEAEGPSSLYTGESFYPPPPPVPPSAFKHTLDPGPATPTLPWSHHPLHRHWQQRRSKSERKGRDTRLPQDNKSLSHLTGWGRGAEGVGDSPSRTSELLSIRSS